jgi:Fur family ferric uptake transcriptional regulator
MGDWYYNDIAAMSRTKPTPSVESLREQIRATGLRVTAPRVAVLQRVLQASAPVTHGELAEALAPQGWDRATIYRNLIDLTEAGILRRTDVGDHVWRFEMRYDDRTAHVDKAHPHFVCDECGDVQCLPEESVELHASRSAPKSLRGRDVEIQLKGRCDRCA